MGLADRVIKANEESKAINAGPELDDIGFPLPGPKTEKAWCNYLTARILYLNQTMYLHEGMLWIDNYSIPETPQSYYKLAKYPKKIKDYQALYVWNKLKEIVPTLDPDIIAVLPNRTFNMRTGEIKNERVLTTNPWEEK